MPLCTFSMHTDILQLSYEQWQLQCCPGLLQITVPPECAPLQPSQSNLNKYKNQKMLMFPWLCRLNWNLPAPTYQTSTILTKLEEWQSTQMETFRNLFCHSALKMQSDVTK